MSQRNGFRLAVAMIALFVAVAGWLWFCASGTGEFRHSPDGRYTAHANNMSTGTLLGGRDAYLEVLVVEKVSGREVWRVVRRYPAGAEVPCYGCRGFRFITWADDSSSVTVPFVDGKQLVLAVP